MGVQEKFIGESPMIEQPTNNLTLKMRDDAVTTPKLADEAVTEAKVDPALLASLRAIDDVPTANSSNPVKSSGIYRGFNQLDEAKQNTITDLAAIRSGASQGSISIQNIRNLMAACNEVFRIGFIGYHIEMSEEPDAHGDYVFNIVMNE